jgi:peptidoglycan/LPS O-acetylase OafA/YrhL
MPNAGPSPLHSTPSALQPTTDHDRARSGWDVLSALRFALALIVALDHLETFSPRMGWLRGIVRLGSFEAILGFLLISGYSIGHSIQKKPEGFFVRRMLRIYPVFLAALLFTYAVQREPLTLAFGGTLLLNLFFLGEAVVRYSYVGAAWSLNLEVWLYALAPVFRRLRATVLELLIGVSFFCYAGYTCGRSLFHWPHYAGTIAGLNLACLAFSWLAGFYLITSTGKRRPLIWVGALFAAHLLLTGGIQSFHRVKHRDLHGFLAVDVADFLCHGVLLLAVFAIFFGVVTGRFHLGLFTRRIFRFLGDISYPLYLLHLPAFALLAAYTRNAWLLLLAALAISTAVYFGCDFYSRRRKLT